jgi:hypothetical protein
VLTCRIAGTEPAGQPTVANNRLVPLKSALGPEHTAHSSLEAASQTPQTSRPCLIFSMPEASFRRRLYAIRRCLGRRDRL